MKNDLMEKAIGLHKHRLKNDLCLSKTERKFVEKWHETNSDKLSRTTLDYLFADEHSERDDIVAETIIQWLGTNVGISFLRDCGFQQSKEKV